MGKGGGDVSKESESYLIKQALGSCSHIKQITAKRMSQLQ